MYNFNFYRNADHVLESLGRIKSQFNAIRHRLIVELVDDFFVREPYAGGPLNRKRKERGQICINVPEGNHTSGTKCKRKTTYGRRRLDSLASEKKKSPGLSRNLTNEKNRKIKVLSEESKTLEQTST